MTYLIGGKSIQKENLQIQFSDIDGKEKIVNPVENQAPNLGINGFIHDLMINPFGYILISEIQVIHLFHLFNLIKIAIPIFTKIGKNVVHYSKNSTNMVF